MLPFSYYLHIVIMPKNTQNRLCNEIFLPPQTLCLPLDTKQNKKAFIYLFLIYLYLCIYYQVYFPSSMLMGAHHTLFSTQCLFHLIYRGKE